MEVTRVVVSYTTASGALILAAIVASDPIAGDEVNVRDIESLQLILVQRSHIGRRQLNFEKVHVGRPCYLLDSGIRWLT